MTQSPSIEAMVRAQIARAPNPLAVLLHAAERHGTRAAIIDIAGPNDATPKVTTYTALAEEVRLLAGALVAAGIGPGDGVAILGPSSGRTLAALIAASAVGVAFPPNPLLSAAAMAAQLALAGTRAVIVHTDHPSIDIAGTLRAALELCPAITVVVAMARPRDGAIAWEEFIAGARPLAAARGGDERAACLFHTGGTTGEPKLAELSAYNVAAGASMAVAALGLLPSDRLFLGLPLFHVGGAICTGMGALAAGAALVFCGVL